MKLNESTGAMERAQSAAADIYRRLYGDNEMESDANFEDYDKIAEYCQDYFLDESISPSKMAEDIGSLFNCTPSEIDSIYEILDMGMVNETTESVKANLQEDDRYGQTPPENWGKPNIADYAKENHYPTEEERKAYEEHCKKQGLNEDTSFPNTIATNPYPNINPGLTSGGVDDVNHIQKNAAEAPKADSMKEHSFRSVDWNKAQSEYLDEHNVSEFLRQKLLPEASRYKVFYTTKDGTRIPHMAKSRKDAESMASTCENDGCTDVKITRDGKPHTPKSKAVKEADNLVALCEEDCYELIEKYNSRLSMGKIDTAWNNAFADIIDAMGIEDPGARYDEETNKKFFDSILNEGVEGTSFPNEKNGFPYPEVHGEANTNGSNDVNHIQKNAAEAPKAESPGLKSGIYAPIKNYDWSKAHSGSLTESDKKKLFEAILEPEPVSCEIDWVLEEGEDLQQSLENETRKWKENSDFDLEFHVVSEEDGAGGWPVVRVSGDHSEVWPYLLDYFDGDGDLADEVLGEAAYATPGATSLHGEDDSDFIIDETDTTGKAMKILHDLIDDGQIDDEEAEMIEQVIDEGNIEEILSTLSPWGFDTEESILDY